MYNAKETNICVPLSDFDFGVARLYAAFYCRFACDVWSICQSSIIVIAFVEKKKYNNNNDLRRSLKQNIIIIIAIEGSEWPPHVGHHQRHWRNSKLSLLTTKNTGNKRM